jgi:anti-anti-sigma factor
MKTVLSVVGDMDVETVPILEAQLDSLIDENMVNVYLDLTGLHSMNDDACLYLLDAKKCMQAKNGRLVMQDTGAPELIKQTLSKYGL